MDKLTRDRATRRYLQIRTLQETSSASSARSTPSRKKSTTRPIAAAISARKKPTC
jgi:hypothetical protein